MFRLAMTEETIRERLIEAEGNYAFSRRQYIDTYYPFDKPHQAEMEKWDAIRSELRDWLNRILAQDR